MVRLAMKGSVAKSDPVYKRIRAGWSCSRPGPRAGPMPKARRRRRKHDREADDRDRNHVFDDDPPTLLEPTNSSLTIPGINNRYGKDRRPSGECIIQRSRGRVV